MEILKNRFNESEAKIIVEFIEAKVEERYQQKKIYLLLNKISQKLKSILLNAVLFFGLEQLLLS